MNLQTTTNANFPTGVHEAIPGVTALPSLPDRLSKGQGRAAQPALRSDTEMVEDAGLGAMTGLGVAMMFNAGLARAGLVCGVIGEMVPKRHTSEQSPAVRRKRESTS